MCLTEITCDIFRVHSRCLAAWFWTCGVCAWYDVLGTTVVPNMYQAHTPQVQNYAAKHWLRTRKISRVISVKHVQHSLMMDHKWSETCLS